MTKNNVVKIAAVFTALALLTSCANTIRGVGKDAAGTVNATRLTVPETAARMSRSEMVTVAGGRRPGFFESACSRCLSMTPPKGIIHRQ